MDGKRHFNTHPMMFMYY